MRLTHCSEQANHWVAGSRNRGGGMGSVDVHRRRAVVAAVVGAIALVVGVVATGVGPGRAEAAVVTGRISDAGGGCLENANNATTADNPL